MGSTVAIASKSQDNIIPADERGNGGNVVLDRGELFGLVDTRFSED